MSVVFAGFPGSVGGAGTEAFETMRMFRSRGLDVHCFPTWAAPDPQRRSEVEAMGVTVHTLKPPQVAGLLRELNRPPVLAFCNKNAFSAYGQTRGVSPFIWINCMTFLQAEERVAWKKHGVPEAFVFQSEYQRQTLENILKRYGYTDSLGHSIRGAFWWPDWEFSPLPHDVGKPFVVGRIARADPAKWSSTTFKCLDEVPNIRALLMGVDQSVARNLERRRYATVMRPGQIPARQFYSQVHAMICKNGSARENWPRVGLEAMALGIPVVADAQWGWKEMIRPGETGFLCKNVPEFAAAFEDMERDEALRLRIAQQARKSLETELANPDQIWRGWCELFRSIGCSGLVEEPGDGRPTSETVLQRPVDRACEVIPRDDTEMHVPDVAPERIEGTQAAGGPVAPQDPAAEEGPEEDRRSDAVRVPEHRVGDDVAGGDIAAPVGSVVSASARDDIGGLE